MPHSPRVPIAVAYFDETGMRDGSPVFGLAGWVAHTRRWRQFSDAWRRILRAAGVSVFHMVDFAHSQGEFKGWSDKKRLSVIRRLCGIAESRTFAGVARAVEADAYRSLVAKAAPELRFPAEPYVFCFQCCLEQLVTMCDPRLPPASIDIVLEQAGGIVGMTRARYEELRSRRPEWAVFGELRFEPKERPALQAADLLVYEMQKYIREKLADTGRPLRKSLRALIERRKVSAKVLDGDALARLLADLKAGRTSPTSPPTFKWLVESEPRA